MQAVCKVNMIKDCDSKEKKECVPQTNICL